MKTEKMMKTARSLEKVFKALQWVAVACIALAVLFAGALVAARVRDPGGAAELWRHYNKVSLGPVSFELAPDVVPDSGTATRYFAVMLIPSAAYALMGWYTLGIFRKILKPMADGKPFEPSVSRGLRRLAFTSLAIGALYNVADVLEAANAMGLLDLDSLVQNGRILSVTTNFRVDVTFIVIFFGLLLLSWIFRYGEELQRQSDETL